MSELQSTYHQHEYQIVREAGKSYLDSFFSCRKSLYASYSNVLLIFKGTSHSTIFIKDMITEEDLVSIRKYLLDFSIYDERAEFFLSKILKSVTPHLAKVGFSYPFNNGDFEYFYGGRIPVIKNVKEVEDYDLIIALGGDDVNPRIYGTRNRYSDFNDRRDLIEVPILSKAIELRKKMFGVCRGHQLINALYGCNMVQDLYMENYVPHPHMHSLEFRTSDSNVLKFFKEKEIASTHHQGVINPSLPVTSTYKGIVESTESTYIITMQAHAEYESSNRDFYNWLFNIWPWMI